MKKETSLLTLAILFYIVPILAFGNFSSIYQWIFLPLFSLVIHNRFTKKVKSEKISGYLTCMIISISISIWNLDPFYLHINHTIVKLSITYGNILGYWLCLMGSYITGSEYRRLKVELTKKEFGYDEKKLDRDKKIDNIINKWW